MQIELSPEAERVAKSLVDTGVYASVDQAVNELVRQSAPKSSRGAADDPEVARKQFEAHLRLLEKVKSLTDSPPHDGLSNRDHDAILYPR